MGGRRKSSRGGKRLLLGLGVLAVAALASGCMPLLIPTAYLNVNRVPTPLADGMSQPKTAGAGSATAAAAATPVRFTGGTLELTEKTTVTLDLAGSWLAWTPVDYEIVPKTTVWQPVARPSEWACPTGAWAYVSDVSAFRVTSLLGNDFAWFDSTFNDLVAQVQGPLTAFNLQKPAWAKPWEHGLQCKKAYDGTKLTVTVPAKPSFQYGATYLYVTTTSSAQVPPSTWSSPAGAFSPAAEWSLPNPPQAIQATAWIKVKINAAAPPAPPAPAAASPAPVAPTARLIARSTPAATSGGMGEYLWRQVDARTSTDPRGSALTYSWDLNGDGVYGDQPAIVDASVTVPAGVAIVPDSVLDPLIAGSGTQSVGVRVTNASGQSSTAEAKVRPVAWNIQTTSQVVLSTEAPVAGASVTATFTTPNYNVNVACVDYDGDGAYESNVPLTTASPETRTFTALAAGPHVVTTAFADGTANCTANPFSVFRAVYVASAAGASAAGTRSLASSARADDYAAATRMTLLDGEVLRESSKAPATTRLDGAVFGGRYRWSVPARGNGKTRPSALAAFARGPYAALASQMTLAGGAANQVGVGSGYMLLRGIDEGDLLCLAITSPGPTQKTLILGGTGAGAKLRGILSGSSLKMPFDALGLVGVTGSGKSLKPRYGQVEPFSNTARLTAGTGKAFALPKACRGLVRHLPAPDDDGSSTPSVVTG